MKFTQFALIAALTFAPVAIFGQTTTAPATTPAATTGHHGYDVNQRKENQQDRIGQGVTSGQLTAGESSHLEKQESHINKEEHHMRKEDDGHLTKQDHKKLRRQQNRESRRIYKDKHNGRRQRG